MISDSKQASQNLYIRKLNGLGEKISVRDSLRVGELKQMVRSLRSLEAVGLGGRDFNLIYKGRNITEKCEQTLRELNIPSDGIIHLVFSSEQQKKSSMPSIKITNPASKIMQTLPNRTALSLRVIFNNQQHTFHTNSLSTVLDLKKTIAIKLNLVYESLILSHLGTEMVDEMLLKDYKLQNQTLISLRFNLQSKLEKKKLETRMVSSVTLSDQNSEPNQHNGNNSNSNNNNILNNQFHLNHKLTTSSNSFSSDKDENDRPVSRLTSLIMPNPRNNNNMYKSQINTSGKSQVVSKAALMFKNALHQKIIETESVVSGEFSQQASISNYDPNCLLITIKNQEQTKQFVFQCTKQHQILDIKKKLLNIQKTIPAEKLQMSLEQDLFQSIDLTKSGCVTLNQIVKKMGNQRAVFIYRII